MQKSVPLICRGHSRPVVDLSFSQATPDGFFLISSCLDGKPILRNGATGDWIGTFFGHKGAVWSSRLNSTATQAITGSADYTAKLWDSISGSELYTFTQGKIIKAVSFSNDDKRIVTGGQEKILRIYDLEKPEAAPVDLQGHTLPIKTILWGPSSHLFFSAGGDNQLRIWDIRSASQVKVVSFGEGGDAISSIELSPDGSLLTCTSGNHVFFADSSTFDLVQEFTVPKNQGLATAALHPSRSIFVTGGSDFWVRVNDFKTRSELEVHKGHHGPVHCVKFAPDGESFASGSEDGTIRLWQSSPKAYHLWQWGGKLPESSTKPTESLNNGNGAN